MELTPYLQRWLSASHPLPHDKKRDHPLAKLPLLIRESRELFPRFKRHQRAGLDRLALGSTDDHLLWEHREVRERSVVALVIGVEFHDP